jgi:hypothetical protein
VVGTGSTLQFALNLLQFGDITGTQYDFVGNDHRQHIYERAGWDICQFSKHFVSPWSELKIGFRKRNPIARREQLQVNEMVVVK